MTRTFTAGQRAVTGFGTCVALLGAAACSSSALHSGEQVGTSSQALTGPVTLTLSAPASVSPLAPALLASQAVTFGAQNNVTGTVVAMGTSGFGLNSGSASVVTGDAWSQAFASLGSSSRVTGTLHAAQSQLGAGASVGHLDSNPQFAPNSNLSWVVTVPSPGPNVALHAAQQLSLTPGNYGTIGLDNGATVTLSAGTYFATNLNFASGSKITLDGSNGPIIVYATGSLTLNGLFSGGSQFFIADLGTTPITLGASGAPFVGDIIAPSTSITFSATPGAHAGYFAAQSLTLAPGANVIYQQPTAISVAAGGTVSSTVPTPAQLPPPPNVRGCYVGTWNGWKPASCSTLDQLPPGVAQKPFIGGGQVTIPGYLNGAADSYGPIPGITSPSGLRFGQVASTVVDVAATGHTELNVPSQIGFQADCNYSSLPYTLTPPQQVNTLSVQANTNNFTATAGDAAAVGDKAWVQFALQSIGAGYDYTNKATGQVTHIPSGFVVCIWNNDFTLGKADKNNIPSAAAPTCTSDSNCEVPRKCLPVPGQGSHCQAPTYYADCLASSGYALQPASAIFNLGVQQRELQALDNANIAGSAFDDGNDGQHDLGMVAALSWFDPNGNGKDYRGLFAVVTKDRYGLGTSTNWTTITGTTLGLGNCGMASFPQGTMLYTSVQAGSCAASGTPPPGTPSTVSWPGVCPNTTQLSSTPAPSFSTASITDESNNLTIVGGSQSALAAATDANHYLEMHYLASVDGQCVSTPRVYVKDHAQDQGSVPSNLGGQAFWESPDILVVPPGTKVTADTQATEPVVIAGTTYDLYVRVHNEYACSAVSGVRARLWWGNAALAAPAWKDIISNGPDAMNPNWSAIKNLPFGDYLDFIGPISWVAPGSVSPHECLLANIQAAGEPAPSNTSDTPNSNQVAQRNIEIGGACAWTLTNGTQASQLGVVFTTTDSAGQSYVLQTGDAASVSFDDASQTLFNAWNSHAHPGCNLSQGSGKTVVTLSTGFGQATVQGAALGANQALNVTGSVVPALFSGTAINLGITSNFSNAGTVVPANGATCSGIAQNGPPR